MPRERPLRASLHTAAGVLRGLEDRQVVCRHVNPLSGLGIEGFASLAVSHLEGPETSDFDALASHQCVLHGGEKGIDRQPAVLLGDPPSERVGDLRNEVGFGHPLLLARCVAKSCLSPRLPLWPVHNRKDARDLDN